MHYFTKYFFILFCLLKTQPFMHYSTSYIILYFILLFNFELVINRLVERLVVGMVDFFITIYRGTVVRLTAVGDAIVSLGRRISRRQPSTGVQVFIYLIFLLDSCIKILGLLFSKS